MTLFDIVKHNTAKKILENQIALKDLNNMPSYIKNSVLDELITIELPNWQKKITSLVESNDFQEKRVKLESRNWEDVEIMWNRYYDEWGMRDYYQDIYIRFSDNTDVIIKDVENPLHKIYIDIVHSQGFIDDEYSDYDGESDSLRLEY